MKLLTAIILAASLPQAAFWLNPKIAEAETGRIVARLGPGGDPVWSPDGKSIAYKSGEHLFVARVGIDSIGRQLSAEPIHGGFTWATDSSLILGVKSRKKSDTTSFREIAVSQLWGGTKSTTSFEHDALELKEVTGGGPENEVITGPWRLSDGTVGYYRCAWSTLGPCTFVPLMYGGPDTTIWRSFKRVVTKERPGPQNQSWGDLWLVSIANPIDGAVQLTSGESWREVAVCPCDSLIAARDTQDDAWCVLDTSRGVLTRGFAALTVGADGLMRGPWHVDWAPDGSQLTYIAVVEDGHTTYEHSLWLYRIGDSTTTQFLTAEFGSIGKVAWSPNSRTIAVGTRAAGVLILEVD